MTFGSPKLLWLLLLVPAAAALLWWSWRARQRAMAQFIGSRLLASLTVGLSTARRKVRLVMLLLSLTLILFSLARPQWGYSVEEARQRGLDIVVAIDTSKSMLADDIQPSRLARAKLAALDLLRLSKTDRLGLVAFAGSAFLQCPLSLDEEAFRQSVEALDVTIIPQGGTAIAEAIQTALSAFKEKTENHKILVLFTDGEENEGSQTVLEAVRAAAKEGMRIFTIGVGTPAGELLSTTDPYGNRVFIKDSAGNVVKSRLNEALLQDIARETDGFYLPLAGTRAMEVLYERGLAPLPKAEFSARTVRRYHERYQWFLGLGILLLVMEMFFPERIRKAKAAVPAAPSAGAVVSAVILLVCGSAHGAANDALQKYQRGKYTESRVEFERLARKSPNDARLRYNAGAAAFQDGSYNEALSHFNAALSSPDLKLQEQSYYNLGNARFRSGEKSSDPKEKQQLWEQAIRDYENALKLDPNDADAKFNSEVVKEKLEELKRQQQQNQDKQQDQQNKDEQKKDEQKKEDQSQQQQDKQDQQKQDQKSEQQKKEEQQNQQQQQQQQDQQKQDASKAEQEKKEQQAQQGQQAPQDQRGEQPDPASQAAQYGKVMQMTPQQAMQLLEAQKSDEKAMIFVPQNVRTNKPNNQRVFKDW